MCDRCWTPCFSIFLYIFSISLSRPCFWVTCFTDCSWHFAPSILRMLYFPIVKSTIFQSHPFANKLKHLWIAASFWHPFGIIFHHFSAAFVWYNLLLFVYAFWSEIVSWNQNSQTIICLVLETFFGPKSHPRKKHDFRWCLGIPSLICVSCGLYFW